MTTERSCYEVAYTRKVNSAGFLLLLVHLPILIGIALAHNGSPWLAGSVMLLLLSGPAVILLQNRSSEQCAPAIAVAAMGVSALTIHLCDGLIEAHFEIFVLIALLTVFGRIVPILLAAVVIALHHVIFWVWLPTSIFNYQASLGIVALHAFFVVAEVIPTCWIARQLGRSIQAQGVVLEHLSGAAEQIADACLQISGSSEVLAEGASKQAASIEETSAVTVEINAMAQRNIQSATASVAAVSEANIRFEKTDRSLSEMVDAMQRMNASSEKISRIIGVIDQIAFQTQILALNAAVEAARAGANGLGFAVVADEVRNLAQRSAVAAKDSTALIEESITNSHSGLIKVNQVAAEIRLLTTESSKTKHLMDQIQVASEEQSRGINQVTGSIHEMEKVTQSNAAGAEQTAAAAHQLTAQSKSILEIVDYLKVLAGAA
jgi:hypothetical protein